MPTASAADELALALELGLATVDEVIAWADARIAEMESPPYAFIEVAMARRAPTSEIAHLLRTIPGPRDPQAVAMGILGRLGRSVRSGETSARQAASLLYGMSLRDELPESVAEETSRLDDAFCLALAGTSGSFEDATADLHSFLDHYAPPCVPE
jgi:hypothetical protein